MPLELKVDSSKIIRMRKSIRHMWDKISSLVVRLVCTSIIYHSINAVHILQFSGVLLKSEKIYIVLVVHMFNKSKST